MIRGAFEENGYDEKVDIYAFGMCAYEIWTKKPPYVELRHSIKAIIQQKMMRKPPAEIRTIINPHLRKFIMECTQYDPKKRPSAAKAHKSYALLDPGRSMFAEMGML